VASDLSSELRAVIPPPTVARLPVYHRELLALSAKHTETVSSTDLALAVGVNAATLRRDLSRLGSTGTRGTGYDVSHLLGRIESALALDRSWAIAIVGVGNLGRALARSEGFSSREFHVAALIDVNPAIVGTSIDGIVISDLDALERVVKSAGISLGVIATPGATAQDVATRLCSAGIRAILNFAPALVTAPGDVVVRHVDLGSELKVLAHYGARALKRQGR
jgi:redox-sensing transcriptional repressor